MIPRDLPQTTEKKKEEKPKTKPNSLSTMMVSTVDRKQHMLTHIVDNFSVRVVIDKETCDLILHTKFLKNLSVGENYTISVMATKDPTPKNAFGAVSLGYMRARWILKNSKLISLNPPIFRGWKAHYKMDTLLEMWE